MRKIFTICILTFAISCADDESHLEKNPIDSKIIIETREVLGKDARKLAFYCKTEKVYPCINFPILTQSTADENSFEITFTGVGQMMACFTALGPATTTVDLGSIPHGEYRIELNNADLENTGLLKVRETEIQLLFPVQNSIEILSPLQSAFRKIRIGERSDITPHRPRI